MIYDYEPNFDMYHYGCFLKLALCVCMSWFLIGQFQFVPGVTDKIGMFTISSTVHHSLCPLLPFL